ncbi:hypothetical protein [Cellulophaga sp. HaHa_2_1]|uniref:hypothetical protein n=1 Tax=Cellulophaga sp. HaHa_2_1 TaxID=2749994 RepID=UPI001C4F8449|nr:hypothetical protein [Cellulophaga sp. HaHa_2_1]QXP51055.1 hypothetical protein H0I24_12975 [Cellulophaga sp. HaHa_2_1]
MEFWGIIYTKGDVIKDLFNSNGYKITNDYAINSNEIKKYCIEEKWILSATNRYLNSLNLRNYIGRSEAFAKVLFSSKTGLLKFDYLEKGKLKEQLVIENGTIKKQIGFKQYTFTSKTTTELFFELIKDKFDLNKDFIVTKPDYFINENKASYELTSEDHAAAGIIFKGMAILFISPLLTYYLIAMFIETQQNDDIKPMPEGLYFVFLGFFSFSVYTFRYVYLEIKNYLLIHIRVLNDGIITLPPKT